MSTIKGGCRGMATAIGNLECGGMCLATEEPAHRAGRFLVRDYGFSRLRTQTHFRRRIEVRCHDCQHIAVYETTMTRDSSKVQGKPVERRGRILSKPVLDSEGEQYRDGEGHLMWHYNVVESEPGLAPKE